MTEVKPIVYLLKATYIVHLHDEVYYVGHDSNNDMRPQARNELTDMSSCCIQEEWSLCWCIMLKANAQTSCLCQHAVLALQHQVMLCFLVGSQQGASPSVISALCLDYRTNHRLMLKRDSLRMQKSLQSKIHVLPRYQSTVISLSCATCTSQMPGWPCCQFEQPCSHYSMSLGRQHWEAQRMIWMLC